jgi:hypothetical protein
VGSNTAVIRDGSGPSGRRGFPPLPRRLEVLVRHGGGGDSDEAKFATNFTQKRHPKRHPISADSRPVFSSSDIRRHPPDHDVGHAVCRVPSYVAQWLADRQQADFKKIQKIEIENSETSKRSLPHI